MQWQFRKTLSSFQNYSNSQQFKNNIARSNRETLSIVMRQIQLILSDRNDELIFEKVLALRFVRDIMIMGKQEVIDAVEKILPLINNICFYEAGSSDKNRGQSYFHETQKYRKADNEDKQQISRLGNTYLTLALQSIYTWAKWIPMNQLGQQSVFSKSYNNLLASNVIFPKGEFSYYKPSDTERFKNTYKIEFFDESNYSETVSNSSFYSKGSYSPAKESGPIGFIIGQKQKFEQTQNFFQGSSHISNFFKEQAKNSEVIKSKSPFAKSKTQQSFKYQLKAQTTNPQRVVPFIKQQLSKLMKDISHPRYDYVEEIEQILRQHYKIYYFDMNTLKKSSKQLTTKQQQQKDWIEKYFVYSSLLAGKKISYDQFLHKATTQQIKIKPISIAREQQLRTSRSRPAKQGNIRINVVSPEKKEIETLNQQMLTLKKRYEKQKQQMIQLYEKRLEKLRETVGCQGQQAKKQLILAKEQNFKLAEARRLLQLALDEQRSQKYQDAHNIKQRIDFFRNQNESLKIQLDNYKNQLKKNKKTANQTNINQENNAQIERLIMQNQALKEQLEAQQFQTTKTPFENSRYSSINGKFDQESVKQQLSRQQKTIQILQQQLSIYKKQLNTIRQQGGDKIAETSCNDDQQREITKLKRQNKQLKEKVQNLLYAQDRSKVQFSNLVEQNKILTLRLEKNQERDARYQVEKERSKYYSNEKGINYDKWGSSKNIVKNSYQNLQKGSSRQQYYAQPESNMITKHLEEKQRPVHSFHISNSNKKSSSQPLSLKYQNYLPIIPYYDIKTDHKAKELFERFCRCVLRKKEILCKDNQIEIGLITKIIEEVDDFSQTIKRKQHTIIHITNVADIPIQDIKISCELPSTINAEIGMVGQKDNIQQKDKNEVKIFCIQSRQQEKVAIAVKSNLRWPFFDKPSILKLTYEKNQQLYTNKFLLPFMSIRYMQYHREKLSKYSQNYHGEYQLSSFNKLNNKSIRQLTTLSMKLNKKILPKPSYIFEYFEPIEETNTDQYEVGAFYPDLSPRRLSYLLQLIVCFKFKGVPSTKSKAAQYLDIQIYEIINEESAEQLTKQKKYILQQFAGFLQFAMSKR